ncbi:hypothetical protein [Pararhizobium qamdonense]|uniref:hypothetical protein n=1 Tax=Pararhizobium qamdonense TaxID=3031126 RepID=UPI0023E33BFE|nr:hypothetical protein [Pararhizobium qamdonense]
MTNAEALLAHFCQDLTDKLDDVGYLPYNGTIEGNAHLVEFINAFTATCIGC